ncbi:DUF4124 domain-containing protein [Marinobacter daepoensis]|uniref:DUF4124 domain-containing protein n=1 Tax=Marinobacter daepoensis TaxID=262077 RepID=A0ABS3BFV9_9GAMM|nr:DUF4124 domain-containing protein [Marinobacter daepoensis]MBN7770718.1 DUF4124 domain-containing protein [Marinobacter daepoensis]MBY6078579.1 DUF4124 domain-containing protein [Marinobacter daepoensis]
MPWKLAASLLMVALALPATAEIYRWTDARGSIHFSDTPPPRQEHDQVTLPPPVTVPMSENIRQVDKVRQSRAQVSRLLAPDSGDRYAQSREHQEKLKLCQGYRKQLDRIQGQLRAGYSNDRGNSLRQKRRKLSQRYSRECVLD